MSDSPHGANSIDSDSVNGGGKPGDKKKSKRPPNTAFRQQRLKAWQPILTPKTVLPFFFAIGVIFAPIGGLLLYASSQVQMIKIEYTQCAAKAPLAKSLDDDMELHAVPSDYVSWQFKTQDQTPVVTWGRVMEHNYTYETPPVTLASTMCRLEFTIPESMGPPVLFYYMLDNFYQNHRRYVTSSDSAQLKGEKSTASTCSPMSTDDETGLPIYPCGLIANSMFNDTFATPVLLNVPTSGEDSSSSGSKAENYSMKSTNIAWNSDKDLYNPSAYKNSEVMPPENWRMRYPKYDDKTPIPNLKEDEHFQVWMRTAGLPDFSKLYMRNDTTAMRRGTYRVDIVDNFPTTIYKGKKSIILTTRTVMGGKNPFAGIAYLVIGGLCILFGTVFTITHLIKPRKLGDHTYLSWNNAPATAGGKSGAPGSSSAVASGRDIA